MSGPEAGTRRCRGTRGPAAARRQRGLSIIELMVGLVVAMLVGLAAAGSAIVFTASQRQGIGVGGVGVSSLTTLTAVKDDIAMAGLGFFGDSAFLCDQMALGRGATTLLDGAAFTPLAVTTESAGDRIDVVYAERIESGANVLLAAASDGTSAQTASLLPVTAGQAVLMAPATPGNPCLMRTVTAVVASTETTPQVLTFGAGGTYNDAVFTAPPTFAERDRIALLGELQWNRYRRVGNTLVLERPFDGTAAVLVRDVIGLRAQYGLAAAGGTTLEDWQKPTGAFATLSPADLPRVRALRIGMVTRSPQRQKPDADGHCDASLDKPELFGETLEPDVTDWQCYRYRATTVVVPLRNLVLGLRS